MATVAEFISVLRNSSPQVHIFHNQTQVYSEHQALGGFYEALQGEYDRAAEKYVSLYGSYDMKSLFNQANAKLQVVPSNYKDRHSS